MLIKECIGIHGAFHQSHRQVEVGPVGGRDRIVEGKDILWLEMVHQVSSLLQIQLQAERDSLSQELRRSRGPHARPCGDGPPNVSDIPPLPVQAQDVEQWMNAINFHLRDALKFGSPAVISLMSKLRQLQNWLHFPEVGFCKIPTQWS